jgi:hypothetical protein
MPHDEIRKARQILARNYEAEFAAANEKRDSQHVEMWHVPERSPVQEEPTKTETEIMQRTWDGWEDWLNGHLKNFADMIGAEIGESDKAIDVRLSALEQKVGELTAESEVRRCAEVVDLPQFIRKRNDNAA